MFFKYRTDNGTQGHSWGLAKERCKLDIRKYAFSQRTINEWNRLPGECVNATSVNMFNNKIDNYFKRSGAGFMNRRRPSQLTAAILTSDLTTHMWVL